MHKVPWNDLIIVPGTLKHVKSCVARSGGIVPRWSRRYGTGGQFPRPGFDPRSRHIFWRPWIFLFPLWPRTPPGFPLQLLAIWVCMICVMSLLQLVLYTGERGDDAVWTSRRMHLWNHGERCNKSFKFVQLKLCIFIIRYWSVCGEDSGVGTVSNYLVRTFQNTSSRGGETAFAMT